MLTNYENKARQKYAPPAEIMPEGTRCTVESATGTELYVYRGGKWVKIATVPNKAKDA